MSTPTRTQAITALLGLVIGTAEETESTPVGTLQVEEGGKAALRVLGVTDDELAFAERLVAQL